MKKYSFDPIIDTQSRLIILGTMPGEESLLQSQYYANPRNQFWELIYSAFDASVDSPYETKCKFLLANKVAIWDVLQSAYRDGSLDSNISLETPNGFREFFAQYPNIKYICFNGAKSEALFKRHFPDLYRFKKCILLPSSSATPGRNVKSFAEKKIVWANIANRVLED